MFIHYFGFWIFQVKKKLSLGVRLRSENCYDRQKAEGNFFYFFDLNIIFAVSKEAHTKFGTHQI